MLLSSRPLHNQLAQPQRHIEAQILLHQACRTDCAGVVSAVAGIDDNTPYFQSQRARQRTLTAARGLCGRRGADIIREGLQ